MAAMDRGRGGGEGKSKDHQVHARSVESIACLEAVSDSGRISS